MKQKFKLVGKDETTVAITVEISVNKYTLTRGEQKDLKERLKNVAHGVLREQGYDVSQIKIART